MFLNGSVRVGTYENFAPAAMRTRNPSAIDGIGMFGAERVEPIFVSPFFDPRLLPLFQTLPDFPHGNYEKKCYRESKDQRHRYDGFYSLPSASNYGYCSSNLVDASAASTESTNAFIVRGINGLQSPTTVLASVAPSVAVVKLPDDLVKLV